MKKKDKKWTLLRRLKFYRNLAKRGVLLHRFTRKGKRYLVVSRTGWRGIKWSKFFEVVQEVDNLFRPLGFPDNEIINSDTSKCVHKEDN